MGHDIEERELVNKELLFNLSSADYERIGKEASVLSGELTVYRETKRKEQLEWNDKISSHEDNVARLLKIIQEGKEVRMANCLERKDFTENKIEYLVDGVVIESRALTGGERQQEMHLAITGGKVLQPDFKKAASGDDEDDDNPNSVDMQTHSFDNDVTPGGPGPEPVECAKEDAVCDKEPA